MLKFNFLLSVIFSLLFTFNQSNAQSAEKEIVRADSLYQAKQYTEAIKIYKNIFSTGKYSPAMLLKISRIEEGMGNHAKAMYFLEKYYQSTKDEKVLSYLEELSEEQNATGFDYDFIYKFNLAYKDYKMIAQIALSVVFIICLLLLFQYRNVTAKKSYFIIGMLILLLLGIINNYNGKEYAIIVEQPSYLLKGPSAGSGLVEQINKPAKVQVANEVDIWTEVIINEKQAYIRSKDLKKL